MRRLASSLHRSSLCQTNLKTGLRTVTSVSEEIIRLLRQSKANPVPASEINSSGSILSPSFGELAEILDRNAAKVVKALDLKPNAHMSRPGQIRVGTKGSLNILTAPKVVHGIELNAGLWYSFETEESGNMLNLVGKMKDLKGMKLYRYVTSSLLPSLHKIPAPTQHVADTLDPGKTSEVAARIQSESQPLGNSTAQRYLNSRGLTNLASPSLLYHPNLACMDKTGSWLYGVPGLVVVASNPKSSHTNIQVTYLDHDTSQKNTKVSIQKRTFGSFQDPLGYHCCQLTDRPHNMEEHFTFLCEGVETALSVVQVLPDEYVLVSLGKGNLSKVDLDMVTDRVVLVWDNDGEHYSKDRVFYNIARRLLEANKWVFVVWPEMLQGRDKTDMNDLLQREGEHAVSRAIFNMRRIIL